MILAIKTDQPTAELRLIDSGKTLAEHIWVADRKLADTLLLETESLLVKQKITLAETTGLIVFVGPGSFTGLRIGITVANTLAYSLNVPIVGTSDDDWIAKGLEKLPKQKPGQFVMPFYGSEPNITPPKR